MRASSDEGNKRCPACGGVRSRSSARFCADCGKLLSEEYEPLDTIRSAYGLQRKTIDIQHELKNDSPLFHGETSGVAQTAWACVVYSMVPYLGILFIPVAFAVSGIGFFSVNANIDRNRRILALCSGLSVLILAAQIVLWWLLYFIPTLSGGLPLAN